MKKIGLLILAVVITGISLSSFLLVSNSTPSKAERCKEMEGKERDYCYFEAARYGYAEGCEKISDVELKDSCFLQAAKIQNRKIFTYPFTSPLDLCEKIGDDKMKTYCQAVVTEDLNLCAEAGNFSDACYRDIAVTKKDKSVCYNIKDGKDNCIFNVYISREFLGIYSEKTCEKIGDEESGARDLCWWNVANMKRDWSLCNRIDNPETRLKCSNVPKNIGVYP